MSTILLKNRTGHKSGKYIRYEFGEDLFGFLFLDVVKGKRHRAKLVKSMLFSDPREFIWVLDREIDRGESLNYLQE